MSISEKQILRADLSGGFRMEGYWIWCGSVLKSSDGYHMYAARWPKQYPMFIGYIYQSEIVHAFSETMCGPYRFVEKVLPNGSNPSAWDGRMAHNPTVLRYGNRFLLYYIGTTYREENPRITDHDRTLTDAIYQRIRIGVAIADSPAGPWKTLDHPVLEPRPGHWDHQIVTNPAPCVLPDGRIYLYYRSNTPEGLRIGLAVADTPEGPYRRVQDKPVLTGFNVEDPFVWHNGSEFEMLAKDMKGTITGELHAGAHFKSSDGIRWELVGKGYSRTIEDSNGNPLHLGCLERPQLLFDENRKPCCLFAAAADGPGGFHSALNTWNIAIPL